MAEETAPKIVAWMKPVCGWSNGVRAVFAKYGLQYEDKDIVNNPFNYAEMVQKTGQYLQPSIEIDGTILADVSGDEVEAWLMERGYAQPAAVAANQRGCEG